MLNLNNNPESHVLTKPDLGYLSFTLSFIATLFLSVIVYFTISENYITALAIPGLIILAIIFFNPRFAYYLFFLSIAIFAPYKIGLVSIHPFDICMGLLLISVAFDYILNVRYQLRPAFFDKQFLFLIFATFISAVFAYDISYSIVPLIRVLLIYLAFRLTFKFSIEIGVRKLIIFYIILVTILSCYNSYLYLISYGEDRVFGITWLTYETYAMTALPMATAFFIWGKNKKERLLYLFSIIIIGFGIIATQSRAPLLTVMIALPVLFYFSFKNFAVRKGIHNNFKLKNFIYVFLIFSIAVFSFHDTIFSGVLERYESFIISITDPEGSIALRLILWSAAWQAFLLDPITGIGIGNFKVITEIIPQIQMATLWERVANMSAHNVFLQYLAETGIIGASALLILAVKGLKNVLPMIRTQQSNKNLQVSSAIFIAIFIFFITIFYTRDWTWGQGGYLLAFFFGLTAAQKHNQEPNY